MNISFNKAELEKALSGISSPFKILIIDIFIEIKKRHLRSYYNDEFDAVGISAGKFCETVFRFLQHEIFGSYIPFEKHIPNFPAELNKIIQSPSANGIDSIRIIIPRALILIYTLRNKRGIGHVGGDIVANQIDIATIVKNIDWVVCELIRIYHNLSITEAQLVINSLNLKMLPDIWNLDNKKRVIRDGLTYSDKVLLILYNELDNKATLKELFQWTEYSSYSMFKSKVIEPLHKKNLIDYDKNSQLILISPKGLVQAEQIVINKEI